MVNSAYQDKHSDSEHTINIRVCIRRVREDCVNKTIIRFSGAAVDLEKRSGGEDEDPDIDPDTESGEL